MTAAPPKSQPSTASVTCSCDWATGECQGPVGCQAANSVASLKARIEELEGALRMFVTWDDGTHESSPAAWHDTAMKAARAALNPKGAA